MMKDLYSLHRDEEDLNRYYEIVRDAYFKIFKRCDLEALYTLAAGGDFTSNYTHEFQVVCPVGEDTIFVCEKCDYAENKEISKLKKGNPCPKCGGVVYEKKSIEVGNIFRYGTKYSEPFNLQFTDEKGQRKFVQSGAYGIGLGRVMGTVVEVSHDSNGIIWPQSLAPFSVHLVSLEPTSPGVHSEAEGLYSSLQRRGIEVLYDDRDLSAGSKFTDSDLIGIPWRLLVSPKTRKAGKLEVKNRKTGKIELVPADLETVSKLIR